VIIGLWRSNTAGLKVPVLEAIARMVFLGVLLVVSCIEAVALQQMIRLSSTTPLLRQLAERKLMCRWYASLLMIVTRRLSVLLFAHIAYSQK
jgi:hypothetical protein